ncbi:MAG: 3-methyl-2-oxobutanoate dehydrogenase subunit VorB, partial [Firmicutes bacterium]|nr:3-methyl-2-oxobutanoate dehydrogenase subunit VorB [Bacillota bacterium]
MKGNEALAEAAVRAGCRFFFGYPITPQNEIPEYMSWRLPEVGGQFIQAESELAAINMLYGAGGAGARAMTSSSSPGVSLKQEGISYMAAAEVPGVIVNMVRGGPGLGGIQPAQSDYYQATRGGGHGDYRTIVFGPSTVQEMVDVMRRAFELADKYRTPVVVLGDGMLGQMMEPVTLPDPVDPASLPVKPWATTGTRGRRPPNVINSLYLDPEKCEQLNRKLEAKYREIAAKEQTAELAWPDAEYFVAAYGTTARICRAAVNEVRERGWAVGLLRPVTLWPFPVDTFEKVIGRAKGFLTVEMSLGQMVDDVRLAVNGRAPVYFFGRWGGMLPSVDEVVAE